MFGISYARSVPVFIDACDLTCEVSKLEDSIVSKNIDVAPEKTDEVIWCIFNSCDAMYNDADKAKLALCRLLLGPVSVPCYCEEWDVNDYMTKRAYSCTGPVIYVYSDHCKCMRMDRSLKYTLMSNYVTTHVFRGLLSLRDWNYSIPSIFCNCMTGTEDRYIATIYPSNKSIYLEYYPYFLCFLSRFISVVEIEECMNDLIIRLGSKLSSRIIIHFKLLFGFKHRPRVINIDRMLWDNFYCLEIQKLWFSVWKHNSVTRGFFNTIFERVETNRNYVLSILRLPANHIAILEHFSPQLFKKHMLYFNIHVTFKKYKKEHIPNSIQYKKNIMCFTEKDVLWKNLFLVFYLYPIPKMKRCGKSDTSVNHYLKVIGRLSINKFRQGTNVFPFRGARAPSGNDEGTVGGDEFSEMTTVNSGRFVVNSFVTNRVINLKATLFRDVSYLPEVPRTMTHSFVMYKHTFKEPACTFSTFVSNNELFYNSLNINIRGPYIDFLYALCVYRLHVNIEDFFLPALVCNSNNSMDIHGIEDHNMLREERNRVYWITNFPCMISTSDRVNIGWFKSGTAIIPRVCGEKLKKVISEELRFINDIPNLYLDADLQLLLTNLEKRNRFQIPFLSKQFVLFLRLLLIIRFGDKGLVHNLMCHLIDRGFFDYGRNIVAHTKLKYVCALIGTRAANNVPKILLGNKKIKLDHLGRNANVLTVLRHMIRCNHKPMPFPIVRIIHKILNYLYHTCASDYLLSELRRMIECVGDGGV
ncbi:component of prereplication complexes [Suid betaherpesvirus 2]|uniref:Component of prereplication complexes n=1 Tax=Suid betaherpesvirus 2 TaxID=1608255 RepID=U3GQ26_9BETA|nr:component of prereplication complexes [Suid betaherpesvirus 2]AGT99250.1 component of prereplication complexes [Suid betaherpesvirus 2]